MKTWIISLGGSVVAPDSVDIDFILDLQTLLIEYVEIASYRFVLVVGGGAPARTYQQAYRDYAQLVGEEWNTKSHLEAQDRIGIMATHLNATFIKEVFADVAEEEIVTNPEDPDIEFEKPFLIGAGWKPGFSTDLDAVMLAKRFEADTIINLSNIDKIYTTDPNIDKDAKPLEHITWKEIIEMVGEEWTPGMHAPFDPVACKLAEDFGLEVISALGRDLDNLRDILEEKDFIGTKISNE